VLIFNDLFVQLYEHKLHERYSMVLYIMDWVRRLEQKAYLNSRTGRPM